ncbi:uncharacterized protein LY89DRAFT_718415 [Mollisia scopiformis]|uniref:Uncharacterized protein n=1 Tax=Mollisia scopiformis TaxID=149040 RepID=A0A194XC98_MOLSC|nr:uncharacterized protein LY89DRAFT_718415 [Mollisia scopiformis]KUJ17798.1 hypothetical protein LY89DRAFT_718415 [Mollisia scopiformis]
MSSPLALVCNSCLSKKLKCVISAGASGCVACTSASQKGPRDCSLFKPSINRCAECIQKHKKCITQIGHSACVLCEHRSLDCTSAPTDRNEINKLRLSAADRIKMDEAEASGTGGSRAGVLTAGRQKGQPRTKAQRKSKKENAAPVSSPLVHSQSTAGGSQQRDDSDDGTLEDPPTPINKSQFPTPRRAASPSETRTRVYPIPDDYVPPSLPMLDPNAPAKAPKEKNLAVTVVDEEEEAEKEAGKEGEKAVEGVDIDVTQPCESNPKLPSFMCCDQVRDCTGQGPNMKVGHFILKEFFTKYAACYPFDEILFDEPNDWLEYDAYLAIFHVDSGVLPVIYGVDNMDKGYLVKIYIDTPRPEVVGMMDVRKTSQPRFYRVPGGADFKCDVHGKKFSVYFMRYFSKGIKFVDVNA